MAAQDANGNINSQRYDSAGNLLTEYHADGGIKQYGYDVFGNKRFAVKEINNERTSYTYDAKNQLVRVDHSTDSNFNNAARFELYDYDEAGRRIRHTNALGAADLTYYDDAGRVKQTTTPAGMTIRYRYIFDPIGGGSTFITLEADPTRSLGTLIPLEADSRTLQDTKDYFGRLLRHVDRGGRRFAYTYNKAGWLVQQDGDTNLAAAGNEQNISFTYYQNGYLKEEIDNSLKTRSRYEYDQNGNRTFEGYTQATSVGRVYYQYSRVQYDELNRVVSIRDPKYDLSYEYDANGNRRYVLAHYQDGLNNGVLTQEYWYAYDSMNRFVVTKGTLQGARGSGTIIAGTTGTEILYNRASERKQATYVSSDKRLQEVYDYAVDGLLTKATITDVTTTTPAAAGRTERLYDIVGNVANYKEFNASGSNIRNVTYTYNADNTVTKENDSSSGVSNFEYDATGNLLRIVNPQSNGTTVTTLFGYEYWDAAKQTRIQLQASNSQAPGWKPGFSNFIYDVNGHLTQVSDMVANRHLSYRLDADGRILQRNELIGSQSSKTQYYYYLNGIGIGDAGGFGPSKTDYAAVLASRSAGSPPPPDDNTIAYGGNNLTRKTFGSVIWKARVGRPVGSADFDYNYNPINDRYPATTPGTYTIREGEWVANNVEQTLRNVAMTVWGDGSLWYVLADANGLTTSSTLEVGQSLVIPNVVANVHNDASTFKVYNPGELIGDTTPTLPDPPPPPRDDDKCFRIVATIIVVVVTIVVAYYATAALKAWGPVAAAILGAAAGNAAGQVTAKALGLREHFSWREVGTAALTAGLNYYVDTGSIVLNALLKETIAQEVRRARGEQEHFDWAALAAAPINNYIDQQTSGVSNATSTVGATSDGFTSDLLSGVTKGVVSQGMAILINRRGKIDWANIAANALGSAIGNAIGADIPGVQEERVRRQEAQRADYERRGYQYEVNPNGSDYGAADPAGG